MKALFIGLGSIGQRHLRNMRELLGDDLVAIAYRARSDSPVLGPGSRVIEGKSVEEEYGVETFSTLEGALQTRPDVAIICNPTGLHVATAYKCADAGCHLLIEKPLSDRPSGIDSLMSVIRKSGLVAAVGFQMRFHPGIVALRDLVRSGDLGAAVSASLAIGEYLPNWHPWEDYRGGYAAVSSLGGGALATQSHEFDYAALLFGPPRSVFAVGGQLSDLDLDVEDVVSVLADHGDGGKQLPVVYNLDYVRRSPVRKCEVVFQRGVAELDLLANTLKINGAADSDTRTLEWPGFDRNELFVKEMQDFLGAVGGATLKGASIDDGMANVSVIDAAKRSMVSGVAQAVELHD